MLTQHCCLYLEGGKGLNNSARNVSLDLFSIYFFLFYYNPSKAKQMKELKKAKGFAKTLNTVPFFSAELVKL